MPPRAGAATGAELVYGPIAAELIALSPHPRADHAVLAAVFSTTSGDPARDRIDTVAQDAGRQIPAWYTQLKTTAVPILGSATAKDRRPVAGGPSGRCNH